MRTLGDWIRIHHSRTAKRDAFVGVDGRVTFGEAADRAWKLARGLRETGIAPGTTVGVLAGNTVFNAELFLGVAMSGGVYAAYNWRWAAEELAINLQASLARVVIVEERFVELLDAALEILAASDTSYERPRVFSEGDVVSLRIGEGEAPDVVTPFDPLCLIYTGGSTGTAKAVVLSHQAALANAVNEHMDLGVGAHPEERGLLVTPMFHSAGLITWLVTHFISGKTIVLVDRFDEASFVEWVSRERATNSFMIPNMMRRLMQAGVFAEPGVQEHFRALHTGAGLLQMPNKREFLSMLPQARLFYRYGLSEAGPMVTRLHHDDILDESVDGSIGQEYTLVETKLRALDGSGDAVPTGELGEIIVRGPNLMTEYFKNPEATANTIVDGWLHTGDLAVRDERGYYFFRDRLKEMIKSGGENVYCSEVEQALYQHPAVLEAAVVGVSNEEWGEEVRAVISLRNGASASHVELSDHLRGYLAGYKIPKQFVFMPAADLPRSGAGKLVKEQLKGILGWE